MKIFVVVRNVSYDIAGETHNLSYHQSEEGAYLRLDKEAKSEGLNLQEGSNGNYYYSDGNGTEMHVSNIELLD